MYFNVSVWRRIRDILTNVLSKFIYITIHLKTVNVRPLHPLAMFLTETFKKHVMITKKNTYLLQNTIAQSLCRQPRI